MNTRFPLCLAFLIGSGFSSCGPTQPKTEEKPPEKPKAEAPSLIGRVASVPADKGFILIQRYGNWEGSTGQILTTRGPDNRTANIRTTGEKLGEFAAADIQSGTVALGDAVYVHHIPKPASTTNPSDKDLPHEELPLPSVDSPTADSATSSAEAEIGNVQKNN